MVSKDLAPPHALAGWPSAREAGNGPHRIADLCILCIAASRFADIFGAPIRTIAASQHDFTTDISEDGILITMPTAESRMKWDNFVRFLESDDIFVLFHSDLIFNILPKRAFTTDEVDRFRELILRKIPIAN